MTSLLRWLWQLLLVRPLAWGVLGLNLHHGDRLPRSGPAVVVANHNSHLDTIVLMAVFPCRCLMRLRPVAAIDYFLRRRWLNGFVVNVVGAVTVKRRDFRPSEGDPLAACSAALERGDILILFPEGTRGQPERLAEFKPGIVHLARRHPDVPVVPVFLHGPGKSLPKGTAIPVPLVCDVRVGDALYWNGARHNFMRCLREEMAKLAGEGRFPPWD